MLAELRRAMCPRPVRDFGSLVEERPSAFSVLSARRASEFPVFHVRNRLGGLCKAGDFSPVHVFEGIARDGGRTTHTFSFPGNATLSEVARGLSAPQSVFFSIGDRIFLDRENGPMQRRLISLVGTESYAFLGLGTRVDALGLVQGSLLSFFDGTRRLRLRVTRCSVVCGTRARLFLNSLERKALFCTVCEKGRADFSVEDNPILPDTMKVLCRTCFDLLFVTSDGSLRYPGMRYSKIQQKDPGVSVAR